MVKITYIEASGEAHTVEAKIGAHLMETAVKNSVPGIVGECGGACACATCRVYIDDPQSLEKTGKPGETEVAMVAEVGDTHPNVRLSCQIRATEALEGLVLRMPESQY